MGIDKSKLLMRTSMLGHVVLWATLGLALWTPDSWIHIKLGLVTWVVIQIGLVVWSWQGRRNAITAIGVLDTLTAVAFGLIIGGEIATNAEGEFLWQFGHVARVVWIGLLFLSGATILRLGFVKGHHPNHDDYAEGQSS